MKKLIFQLSTYDDPIDLIPVIERLAELGNQRAVPHLIKVLVFSKDETVRSATITALGTIGGLLSIDALSQAAKSDPNFLVRYNATVTLNKIKQNQQDFIDTEKKEKSDQLLKDAESIFQKSLATKSISYLEIEPERFTCPNCKNKFSLRKIDLFKQYTCPYCNSILKRRLKCTNCKKELSFKQEDFFRFLSQKTECPSCANKPDDTIFQFNDLSAENDKEMAIKSVFNNITSKNKKLREEAAKGLQSFIKLDANPSLVGLLMYDEDPNIRTLATITLGMIGTNAIYPVLKNILDHERNAMVRKYIVKTTTWLEKRNS